MERLYATLVQINQEHILLFSDALLANAVASLAHACKKCTSHLL